MTTGQIIGLIISILFMLSVFVGIICEFILENNEYHRRKKEIQKQKEVFVFELYSSYLNLQIENYILSENNLKLEKENIRLRNRIKKLKGEEK